ncbi:hypothetical protein SAMN05443661_11629 [Natronobacterium gregoryi]|uniref:Uncharacterized protein n=2 Tax=Natronobacterium gregoryi TaxID=44930 RepID=L0AI86_NATGS|nr:hypothetical protein Natgr_2354 [Natronobacterium gregoryi SP2]SFJ16905.1 hypothetical protein SAMN05443661_11629 [Natronobacterium gregoryi]
MDWPAADSYGLLSRCPGATEGGLAVAPALTDSKPSHTVSRSHSSPIARTGSAIGGN